MRNGLRVQFVRVQKLVHTFDTDISLYSQEQSLTINDHLYFFFKSEHKVTSTTETMNIGRKVMGSFIMLKYVNETNAVSGVRSLPMKTNVMNETSETYTTSLAQHKTKKQLFQQLTTEYTRIGANVHRK